MNRYVRILAMAAAAATIFVAAASAEPIRLKDVEGREVVLPAPPERILLGFYFEEFLAVGGAGALDRVVGLSRAAWADWRPASWRAYVQVLPGLERLADVGEVEVNTFSVEKALALRPDVAILASWQEKGLGQDFQRLAAAGVPLVVIDYHAERPERHIASTRILGQVLGSPDRAEAIAGDYAAAIGEVAARIARAGRPRPAVYIELGNKGPEGQGVSYGGYMWGALAEMAGGRNVTREVVRSWAPVASEQVLAARPEVIVIAGSEWRQHATAQLMGVGVTAGEARGRLAGFLARPGWSDLPAVRERRVHAIYHGNSRTVLDYTAVQYLAKAFYPDLFADIDPAANYRAFFARYLPVQPEGTWMIGQE